jgi:transposase
MKTILAAPNLLKIENISFHSDEIRLIVKTRLLKSTCPSCGWQSDKVHSRYRRQLADLPWEGITARLILSVRKFFCLNPECRRQIFCERLPGLAAPYARKTLRLNELLTRLGVALGGRPGARLALGMAIKIGRDALLARVRCAETVPINPVRVLGVDDFAFRKGQSYGTILVDQGQHRIVGLLPDREAATLANWLEGHSGIEIVTRDRASYYADGIKKGAPQAVQIADRWHLQKNLREMLENVLSHHRSQLKKAAAVLSPHRKSIEALSDNGLPNLKPKQHQSQRTMKQLAEHEEKRAQRVKRYEEVKRLQATGVSISAIGRQMGMHRETVRQFLRADEYPEARPPIKPSKVSPFTEYLKKRWLEGCYNARQLYREIKLLGYEGHLHILQAYLEPWRRLLPEEIRRKQAIPAVSPPTPRMLVWWLLKGNEKLKEEQRAFIRQLLDMNPIIKEACELAWEFRRMITDRDGKKLNDWLRKAEQSGISEVISFVKRLRKDKAAVQAAMEYEWSNGQVEGQVNRLKMVKRQMFGRAKFDLLKARILVAA